MREVGNLKRIGEEFSKQDAGTLSIATTHSQARYFLPEPVAQLRKRFPKVNISLHQGSPDQVARMVIEEVADIGLATESLDALRRAGHPALLRMAARAGDAGRPPAGAARAHLAGRPGAASRWSRYHPSFSGRTRVDQAFAARKLKPNIVLEAIDADVIKTYVRLGLGVGIVAEIAVRDDPPSGDLVSRPVGHLFGQNVTRVAFKRGAYLRNFVYAFAEMLSDRLSRALITHALSGQSRRRRTTSSEPDHHDHRHRPHALDHQPPAARRHHHLHRDVGAGPAARRGQPRPGLPGLRLRPAPARCRRTRRCARGLNQYPPMAGVPVLREAVAAKIEALYGRRYDAGSEITITAGATQAIITAILAIVHPGDEVIVLDPCYDSYEPNIELAGGRAVHVPLTPGSFAPDFARIAAALTPRTRAIIINTPHNPSATVWTAQRHAAPGRAAARRPTCW